LIDIIDSFNEERAIPIAMEVKYHC